MPHICTVSMKSSMKSVKWNSQQDSNDAHKTSTVVSLIRAAHLDHSQDKCTVLPERDSTMRFITFGFFINRPWMGPWFTPYIFSKLVSIPPGYLTFHTGFDFSQPLFSMLSHSLVVQVTYGLGSDKSSPHSVWWVAGGWVRLPLPLYRLATSCFRQ